MKELIFRLLHYVAGNYQKIFIRLILLYVLLYPIVAVYSILGTLGNKRVLDKSEVEAGPLVRERPARNQYIGEDSFTVRHALGTFGLFEAPIHFEKAVIAPEKREKLVVDEDQMQEVLLAARNMYDDFPVDADSSTLLYVTIINDAFQDLALNWLCNVQPFETILNRTLIIAGSKRICARIEKEYSEVSCVPIALPTTFNRDFEERQEHRREFTAHRLRILGRLVEEGVNLVFFDTDSMWLRDPTHLFRNATEQLQAVIVVGASYTDEKEPFSSDPMLIVANNRTASLLREARRLLTDGEEKELKEVINILCLNKFNDIRCDRFQWSDVADGEWLDFGPRQRARYSPYIVSNNLQREIIDKTARQQINDMWLLRKGKCSEKARKKFFTEYGDKEFAKKHKDIKDNDEKGFWERIQLKLSPIWSEVRWNLGKIWRFLHLM